VSNKHHGLYQGDTFGGQVLFGKEELDFIGSDDEKFNNYLQDKLKQTEVTLKLMWKMRNE